MKEHEKFLQTYNLSLYFEYLKKLVLQQVAEDGKM